MPATYTLIASTTIPSATAAYTFNSIPSTYTDLKLVWSALLTVNTDASITFNSSTSGYNYRSIFQVNQTGGGAPSTYGGNVTDRLVLQYFWGSGTTFNPGGMYITNYASATQKSIWTDNAQPNLTSNSNYSVLPMSHNWNSTATISSLTFTPGGGNIAANSQFSLYGIKNS
jgi:acyl-CoA synthetase (AMP-forming)/AMP-acid ligase II